MKPVSIIIPSWNNLEYLKKWFETFRAKNAHPEYEIIIIDQGSTDGSIEFLEGIRDNWGIKESTGMATGLGKFIIIRNSSNTGSTGAWNQGIKASKHQWMAIMNSDIEFLRDNWLERFLEQAKDDVGIVECLETIWNKETRWAGASGFLLNRKMVEDIGMFDQKNFWGFCGDTDYWIRCDWHKWKMGWCTEILYFHHCGGTHRRGMLKDSAPKDHEEANKLLRVKWTAQAISQGWNRPRLTEERWLQEERKAGRLA